MDIFEIHRRIVGDYANYIRSFVSISDVDLRQRVAQHLNAGHLWPEPLLSFNPAFASAGKIERLVSSGGRGTQQAPGRGARALQQLLACGSLRDCVSRAPDGHPWPLRFVAGFQERFRQMKRNLSLANTSSPHPTPSSPTGLLTDVRELILSARQTVARGVNAALVALYWKVGQRIRTEILNEKRAEYGQEIVVTMSQQLTTEFGNGFSRFNLS